nr:hypothetical protein CFP56_38840 [Quercus suber]
MAGLEYHETICLRYQNSFTSYMSDRSKDVISNMLMLMKSNATTCFQRVRTNPAPDIPSVFIDHLRNNMSPVRQSLAGDEPMSQQPEYARAARWKKMLSSESNAPFVHDHPTLKTINLPSSLRRMSALEKSHPHVRTPFLPPSILAKLHLHMLEQTVKPRRPGSQAKTQASSPPAPENPPPYTEGGAGRAQGARCAPNKQVDYEKLRRLAKLASPQSARELLRVAKKKLRAEYGVEGGGQGDSPVSLLPVMQWKKGDWGPGARDVVGKGPGRMPRQRADTTCRTAPDAQGSEVAVKHSLQTSTFRSSKLQVLWSQERKHDRGHCKPGKEGPDGGQEEWSALRRHDIEKAGQETLGFLAAKRGKGEKRSADVGDEEGKDCFPPDSWIRISPMI